LAARAKALAEAGGYPFPANQTPWQKIFRDLVEPFSEGMTLRGATDFHDVAHGTPPLRNNH